MIGREHLAERIIGVGLDLKAIRQSRLFWPLMILIILLGFNLFRDPGFFVIEYKNGALFGSLVDILNRAAPVALVALGMSLVIATGGIDLSVGSVVAISGSVAAYLVRSDAVTSTFAIIAISLGVSMVAGMWNGMLVTLLGIQPFVATLILMVAGRGIAQLITDGQILTFNHSGIEFLGTGFFLALPFTITIVVCCYFLASLVLRKTALGLYIESIGLNPLASRYVGIQSTQLKIAVYSFCSLMAGLAGLILTANIKGADANNVGLWIELDAILAVVVGGTAMTGGRFFLSTTLIGVLILQTLTTTILSSGLPVEYTYIVKSIVVIVAMLLMSPEFRKQLAALGGKGVQNEQ